MTSHNKSRLYFVVAAYFGFWAALRLRRWRPLVVVVTGSNGKTTMLHMLESQLGKIATYSYKANSAFGIPFDILGLHRRSFSIGEWPLLLFLAPFKVLWPVPKQHIYIAETDCERPGEGKFLAHLLTPQITIWLSLACTHSASFDPLVDIQFATVKEAIAYEFGWYLQHTQKMVLVNSDDPLLMHQTGRTQAEVRTVSMADLHQYIVTTTHTSFTVDDETFDLPFFLPKETWYQLAAALALTRYVKVEPDRSFKQLRLPPGRSNIFAGIHSTVLIDSSYNANLASITAMLSAFSLLPAAHKWLVLGDLIEQGNQEQEEYEALAELITKVDAQRILLIGPHLAQYTLPILQRQNSSVIITAFNGPAEALLYSKAELVGNEVILFKGARFLEGIIEQLLINPADAALLYRREGV